MLDIIKLKTSRDEYDKIITARDSMTVAELIEELKNYPEDAKVIFSNDGGYTYGYVGRYSLSEEYDVPNIASYEESELEGKVDDAIESLIDDGTINEECKTKDIIEVFDEICKNAGIEDSKDERDYARHYIYSNY